jgi:hypothetical protein
LRLGKSQLALLLIVDQSTRVVAGCKDLVGCVFMWEESIRYIRLDGEVDSFFMMRGDLKSLDRLCEQGLVQKRTSSNIYTITDTGRAEIEKRRTRRSEKKP